MNLIFNKKFCILSLRRQTENKFYISFIILYNLGTSVLCYWISLLIVKPSNKNNHNVILSDIRYVAHITSILVCILFILISIIYIINKIELMKTDKQKREKIIVDIKPEVYMDVIYLFLKC